jgi:chromosome partitioning protein
VLLDLLRANPSLSEFDYILIDCPPGLTRLTLNALVASDCYVVPLGLDLLSLNGLLLTQKAFREYLAEVEKQALSFFLIHHPQLAGILFPRVRYNADNQPEAIFGEVERRAKMLFPGKVFDHHIRDDDAVLRAVAMKRPFFTLTSAKDSLLIEDFEDVMDEFIRRVEKIEWGKGPERTR